MADIWNALFSPLGKEYCNYYLILCMISAFFLGLTIISELVYFVRNIKKISLRQIFNGLVVIFNVFLGYLSTRIMYSVCVKAL